MKKILNIASLLILIQLCACSDENEPTQLEKSKTMLTATVWGDPVVTHGTDGDLSEDYADFVITFSQHPSNGYEGIVVVSNGSHAFPESTGSWKFNDDLTKIILDSGRELEFQLDETHLKLDFTVASSGGRVNGLSGHFIFDLKPL